MRSLLTLSILALLVLFGVASTVEPAGAAEPVTTVTPAGSWDGAIELPNGKLAINVTLERGAEDGWTGTIDIPAQGLHGFALSAVSADGERVHFEMAGVPGTPTFEGELADSGEAISGTFQQGGQSLPFSLERAADDGGAADSSKMPVEGVPGEGAAGEWKGSLDVGPVTLRLALHVEAEEDGGLSAVFDSLDQGASLPVDEITFGDGALRFKIDRIGGTFEGTMNDDGSAVEGTWSQGGRSFPLTFYRTAEPFALARPQTPEPPFPYQSRDITFPNETEGITLAGTLLTPDGDGPFPAVVFVSGSGAQDRDEALMGHRPFLVIADALARRGIASLRYDDRGFGESGGDHLGSTVDDFATDAEAALETLAAQPKIDPKAVGILGHSEGGLIGPKVAAHDEAVDFLVLLAPPGEPLPALLQRQARALMKLQGVDQALIDDAMVAQKKSLALIADPSIPTDELRERLETSAEARRAEYSEEQQAALNLDDGSIRQELQVGTSPWFRSLMREDPAVALHKVKVPVLALFGGKDFQVDPQVNSQALRTALEQAGDDDVTIRILPGLNHLFQHAESGSISEYGTIEETISPEVLQLVGDWIEARFGHSVETPAEGG